MIEEIFNEIYVFNRKSHELAYDEWPLISAEGIFCKGEALAHLGDRHESYKDYVTTNLPANGDDVTFTYEEAELFACAANNLTYSSNATSTFKCVAQICYFFLINDPFKAFDELVRIIFSDDTQAHRRLVLSCLIHVHPILFAKYSHSLEGKYALEILKWHTWKLDQEVFGTIDFETIFSGILDIHIHHRSSESIYRVCQYLKRLAQQVLNEEYQQEILDLLHSLMNHLLGKMKNMNDKYKLLSNS